VIFINIQDELKIIGSYPSVMFNGREVPPSPKYNTPITPRENVNRFFRKGGALWTPCGGDIVTIIPKILPDNPARAFVFDLEPFDMKEAGGKDFFGIEWEYIPQVGGSMVRPGKGALLEDVNDWEKVIKFPNLDDYDWEGSSKRLKEVTEAGRAVSIWVMNGLFERLISFMEFENAALALIDEDQKDAVHALFSKLCDFYDDMFRRFKKYYNADGIYFHDDWGSQRAPFFSLDVCREMIVPYLKRVCDTCHELGMYLDLHSCGFNELLVPAMIEAGVDVWSGQTMNDRVKMLKLYGDKIKLNIAPDPVMPQPGATKEEMEQAAKESLDKFIDTYGPYLDSILVSGMGSLPGMYERIYTLTRKNAD
jgi:hypothetical protein